MDASIVPEMVKGFDYLLVLFGLNILVLTAASFTKEFIIERTLYSHCCQSFFTNALVSFLK